MNMQMLVCIGLLYFVEKNEIVYFDSFGVEHVLKKSKNLSEIKTSKQIYLECNQTIQ